MQLSPRLRKGARFSSSGFLRLLKRSEDDHILAEHLGMRKDIPRHIFQQLISKASDEVKRKLERERPEMGTQIQAVVTDVTPVRSTQDLGLRPKTILLRNGR